MLQRITWTANTGDGKSGWNGSVGDKVLFSIQMSTLRNTGFELGTRLPVGLVRSWSTGKSEDLKAYAERIMERFLRSIGAEWTE
jgi:hypothetical protein